MTPDLKRLCEAAANELGYANPEIGVRLLEPVVRAVLMALREPSAELISVGGGTECMAPNASGPLREPEALPIGEEAAGHAFIAMIDHILAEPVSA